MAAAKGQKEIHQNVKDIEPQICPKYTTKKGEKQESSQMTPPSEQEKCRSFTSGYLYGGSLSGYSPLKILQ
jgi:hypothetical protein